MSSELNFSEDEYAVVCLLLLRGPQTPGELRARSGRLHVFADHEAVAETLRQLMDTEREGGAVVARLARVAGRRDHQHAHLLSGAIESVPADDLPARTQPRGGRLAELERRVAASTLIMIPLFVPPVIIGLGALTFHRAIGIWGTHFSIAVAHSLWAVPLVFVVLRSTLGGVDRSVEEAAAGLGASPIRVFFEVTLPLVASGVFVGVLFAFIISVNDFIMALFLSTADIKTLPVAIRPQIRYLLTPIVAAASSVIIVITVVLLIVAARATNIRRLVEFR